MATIATYTFTDEDLIKTANQVLQLLEARLHADGVIDSKNAISKKYAIGLAKKGMFAKFVDSVIFRKEPHTATLVIFEWPSDFLNDESEEGEK